MTAPQQVREDGWCRRCGRHLVDPVYAERGLGPRCGGRIRSAHAPARHADPVRPVPVLPGQLDLFTAVVDGPQTPGTATAGRTNQTEDTMATTHIETVAPYPANEEQATADAMIRHLLGSVLARTAITPDMDMGEPGSVEIRAFALHLVSISGDYALITALRAAKHADPAAADALARQIWSGFEYGEGVDGLAWDWANELGMDPDRIVSEARERFAAQRKAVA